MRFFGFDVSITRTPTSPAAPVRGSGGWWPVVREPSTGAWQRNEELRPESALAYYAVFTCTTLIAGDIGKCRLRLVELTDDGIWREVDSTSLGAVLRKPNRYQTINKFIEHWIVSKLNTGNTYALKQRDARGVVRALYVLDPCRVTPLVTESGDVYYQLQRDDLSGLPEALPDGSPLIVPADEVIHDLMVPLFHPLIGVSPIFACGMSALQGLNIQRNSSQFFANGSRPGGVLTAPGAISDATATRLKEYWNENFSGANAGKVAVVGDGLKYEPMTMTAVEAQLVDQLNMTAAHVCAAYHVPAYMAGVGEMPPYANSEPMLQLYYSQCLQTLMTSLELALDDGLELPAGMGTEFDIDDLIWLDHATRTEAASKSAGSGAVSPNEARKKYWGSGRLSAVTPRYMQQQNYSLAALAMRDAHDPLSTTPPAPLPPVDDDTDDDATITSAFHVKDWGGVYAGR